MKRLLVLSFFVAGPVFFLSPQTSIAAAHGGGGGRGGMSGSSRGGGYSGGSRGGSYGGAYRGGSVGYRGGYRGGGYGGYRGGYYGGYRGSYGGYRGGYGRYGYGYAGFGLGFGLGYYGAYNPYGYSSAYYSGDYYPSSPYYPSYDSGPVTYSAPQQIQQQAPPQVNVYTPQAPLRERQDPPTGRDANGSTASGQSNMYLFAFPDGSVQVAIAYWTDNGNLHYVTRDKAQKTVSLSSIDRATTEQLNRERGVALNIP